jgi:DNA-binding NarL/FixJ family response regulator
MWNASKSFEEWKPCVEFMLLQSKVEEILHRSEVAVYVKKLEHLAMVEKQKMMQQGKPSFNDSMIDEVMELRKEHELLKKSNSELRILFSDIELLIERKSHNVNGNGLFLDQLHDIIQKGKSKQPAIESCLMECENSHPDFSRAILTVLPNITAMELKIAKLIKLGLTTQSIATLCGVTVKSIENHRIRLRKKCNLSSEQSLSTFIVSIT